MQEELITANFTVWRGKGWERERREEGRAEGEEEREKKPIKQA